MHNHQFSLFKRRSCGNNLFKQFRFDFVVYGLDFVVATSFFVVAYIVVTCMAKSSNGDLCSDGGQPIMVASGVVCAWWLCWVEVGCDSVDDYGCAGKEGGVD